MKSLTALKRAALVAMILGCIWATATDVGAVTQNYYGTSGALSTSVWSTIPAGPYTSAFNATGGGVANFDNVASQTAGANTLVVAGISATQNFSITGSPTGTISNQGNVVIPVSVASGVTLDFGSQAFTTSATAGYNFTGPGTLALLGGTYGGGFTINSGTLIVRGVNAMGSNAANTLTINGGTIASNATRDLSGKFGGGITVNGNFTTGGTTGLASATATLTFSNNVNLNGATRTITIGGNATGVGYTFSGKVSNGGLIIDATGGATGRVILLSATSDYGGGTTIKTGATLSTNGISSTPLSGTVTSGPLGVGALTFDGGNYIPSSGASNTIGNAITLNNFTTNRITNSTSSGIGTTLSGAITGSGGFIKGGAGILILTGANNYGGPTIVESGVLGLAKTQSFYGGNPVNWTDANFSVESGAGLVFAVGGTDEFSFPQFLNLATVGTLTGGFKNGSSIGIDTTNGGDQTISTIFADNNSGVNKLGLLKSGANTLFLTAANTHSGPTTVAGGTLFVSNLLALQNSTLTTTAAGTVVFDQAAFSTAISLGGLAGTGSLTLQNDAGAPLAFTVGSNNADASSSAALSGSGSSITKVGNGVQTLSGTNTYDGGTIVNSGTLAINSASAIGSGPLTLANAAILDNTSGSAKTLTTNNDQNWNGDFYWTGTAALNLGTGSVTMAGNTEITASGTDAQGNTLTVGGVISGAGFKLTKSGPGRINLAGQNTFDGGVTVIGGSVHAGEQSSNLGSGTGPLGTGPLTINAGRFIASSTGTTVSSIENAITLIGAASTNTITNNGTLTLSGVISGTGGFNKTGNGTLNLTNENTFSGDTNIIENGTAPTDLNLSHQLALKNSTLVTSSTGGAIAFDASVAGNAFTLGGLSGSGNLLLENNSGAGIELTVGNNNGDTEHTGALTGLGSLVKTGSGATKLAGANLYVGATTVNNGTLLVNGSHSGGAYTVNSPGTLGGTGTINSSVLVNANGVLAPGASVGTLTVADADIDGNLKIEFGGDAIDKLVVGGTLDLTNATVDFSALGSLVNGEYVFATYGTLVGSGFASVLNLPGSLALHHDTTNKWFSLLGQYQAGLPGDFNHDNVVDARDYVVWRKTLGDATNYNLWRSNFGAGAGAGAGSNIGTIAAVPEPAALGLLLSAALTAFSSRFRTNRFTP